MTICNYNHLLIEKKARKILKNCYIYNKKKLICLSMFPYPSGKLHIGHVRNYTINDVICRYKNINGYQSKMFFGWDSFGLPAEKASILEGVSPEKWVCKNIKYMKKQIKYLGFHIDWDKEIKTSDVEFYSISQNIFSFFWKNNYIYLSKKWVNWDPVDKTVLANEQVVNGRGWRSGSKIEKRRKTMYFLKVKRIVKNIYNETKKNNYNKKVIKAQLKWIGRKKFFFIKIKINNFKLNVYFKKKKDLIVPKSLIFSYDFEKVLKIFKKKKILLKKIRYIVENNIKIIFSGIYFKTTYKRKVLFIPIFISNLNTISNIFFYNKKYFENFNYISVSKFNNKKIKKIKIKKEYLFKINDWCLSRQRKWGTPIPIAKCKNCGFFIQKIPVTFKKKEVFCKKCKIKSITEKNTLDTFFDSSWYFLKYFSNNPLRDLKKFNVIDIYIGGVEHSILHLLYVKMFFAIFNKTSISKVSNPFKLLIINGMVLSKTIVNGKLKYRKMSKSKNNGVDPVRIIKKFGCDSLRMYILFSSKIEDDIKWSENRINGCVRFLNKVWNFYFKNYYFKNLIIKENKFKEIENKIYYCYDKFKFNVLISNIMKYFNLIRRYLLKFKVFINEKYKNLIIYLFPICPHFSSVIWQLSGYEKKYGKITKNNVFCNYFTNKKKNIIIQLNGKKIKIEKFNKKIDYYKKKYKKKYKNKLIKRILFIKNILNFITE
ncbi:class I tRNA ligase family protein [Candidatus Vidania fulgoroideorum]